MKRDLLAQLEARTGRPVDAQPRPHSDPLPRVIAADERELAELLHWAATEHLRVLAVGSGTRLGLGPPIEADFALSTEALHGVVAHEAGDGTLTARAGTPLAELAAVARSSGHLVAPVGEGGTLGGALAAGDEGREREATGPARDHLLGARLALPNGDVVSSGGRLVKNVTGYDLHRLACGARGTTGVLVEATLRLLPAPERVVRVRWTAPTYGEAHGCALGELRGTSPPRRCEVAIDARQRATVTAELGGSAPTVEAQLERLRALRRLVVTEREPEPPLHDPPRVELTTRPSRLPRLLASLEVARLAGRGGVLARPLLGRLELFFERSAFDVDEATRLTEQALGAGVPGLRVAWRNLPVELARADAVRLHALGPAPSPAAPLEARIQRALDPAGALAR